MTSSNEKIVEEELNNDTESQIQVQYDDLRLSKLGFRIRLVRAINMLGANGISLSLWGVFIAILVFLNKIEEDHIFGVFLLLVSTIYLFMFFFMVMKNKEKNLSGVTNILRLICSFTGVVMLSSLYMAYAQIFVTRDQWSMAYAQIFVTRDQWSMAHAQIFVTRGQWSESPHFRDLWSMGGYSLSFNLNTFLTNESYFGL